MSQPLSRLEAERLDYNLRITELLKTILRNNPSLRFMQLLDVLSENCFRVHQEPKETYNQYVKKVVGTGLLNGVELLQWHNE